MANDRSGPRQVKTYCRICQGFCGMVVTVENDRILKVRGDKSDPMSRGYACYKGLQAVEQHYGEGRLLQSLHRVEGELRPAPSVLVLRDAGERLRDLIARHGPTSVGFFMGTQSYYHALNGPLINSFADALGTPRRFVTMTIDQSAKWVAESRMGGWHAGAQRFDTADAWMFVGSNPLVSMATGAGPGIFVIPNPVKLLREARARGMRVIVIDPRRTETAKFADLHLQLVPGRDAELAASLLHVILHRGWHDRDFCDAHVSGVERLAEHVEPFAPQRVADMAGVAAEDIERAAALFARDSRTGMVGTGTGPDMARHSNLAEHLYQSINIVCGRFPREGDDLANTGVLMPSPEPRAEVVAPNRDWEAGPKTLVHGLGPIRGTMMSAEIANEILIDHPQRMRALICVGGNLAVALPDQARAIKALEALELLIVIDPRLGATARHADFVIAPTLQYERADHTGTLESFFQLQYAHATRAVVPPPDGADVVAESEALWSLAKAVGIDLSLGLEGDGPPGEEALLGRIASGGRLGPADLMDTEGGILFDGPAIRIGPRSNDERFELLADDVAGELTQLARKLPRQRPGEDSGSRRFQLTVRRHRELMNSFGADFEATWKRLPGNPAYLHPDDIADLGLAPGAMIRIVRGNRSIAARVAADADLRRGVVSISHGWSGTPDEPWSATNALVDADSDVQAINRMPVMTGFEVELRR